MYKDFYRVQVSFVPLLWFWNQLHFELKRAEKDLSSAMRKCWNQPIISLHWWLIWSWRISFAWLSSPCPPYTLYVGNTYILSIYQWDGKSLIIFDKKQASFFVYVVSLQHPCTKVTAETPLRAYNIESESVSLVHDPGPSAEHLLLGLWRMKHTAIETASQIQFSSFLKQVSVHAYSKPQLVRRHDPGEWYACGGVVPSDPIDEHLWYSSQRST